ncbi:ribbon-helix-helix protein, CopG family [Candidatus Saccharibacteria bacterium]|nr:ribbon-helix-helix protein, CopG family [Candidatus Saccharibacteria bacterium]
MASKTFNISLPEDLVKKIDKQAKKEYSSRSDYIRKSLTNQLKSEGESVEDKEVITAAKQILSRYRKDFENLADR